MGLWSPLSPWKQKSYVMEQQIIRRHPNSRAQFGLGACVSARARSPQQSNRFASSDSLLATMIFLRAKKCYQFIVIFSTSRIITIIHSMLVLLHRIPEMGARVWWPNEHESNGKKSNLKYTHFFWEHAHMLWRLHRPSTGTQSISSHGTRFWLNATT